MGLFCTAGTSSYLRVHRSRVGEVAAGPPLKQAVIANGGVGAEKVLAQGGDSRMEG